MWLEGAPDGTVVAYQVESGRVLAGLKDLSFRPTTFRFERVSRTLPLC